MKKLFFLFFTAFLTLHAEIVLQVLGSGGPESTDGRASSGYLIWINGEARVLVDIGGGASLRYEESGAKIKDLEVILLTHLHVDHTADLSALLKASFFTPSQGNLYLFGPDENHLMPNTNTFVNRLFENDKGAWQYLGDHLDGTAKLQIKTHTIQKSMKVKSIYQLKDLKIEAVSVHHGPIPAMAYRINIGDKSITLSGDMNGKYQTLEKLAKDTDILVAHNAIPQDASGIAAKLHMTPLTIGKIAKRAQPEKLILSHRMLRTLGKEKETLLQIRKNYQGPVHFANDLDRFKLK